MGVTGGVPAVSSLQLFLESARPAGRHVAIDVRSEALDYFNGRDARVCFRISFDSRSSSTRRASTMAPTMADQAAIPTRHFF